MILRLPTLPGQEGLCWGPVSCPLQGQISKLLVHSFFFCLLPHSFPPQHSLFLVYIVENICESKWPAEMKDLGKGLFFFAWLQGSQMRTSALQKGAFPQSLAPERRELDLNEDRPEGGPARLPRQEGCFSSRTGWPGGKWIPSVSPDGSVGGFLPTLSPTAPHCSGFGDVFCSGDSHIIPLSCLSPEQLCSAGTGCLGIALF